MRMIRDPRWHREAEAYTVRLMADHEDAERLMDYANNDTRVADAMARMLDAYEQWTDEQPEPVTPEMMAALMIRAGLGLAHMSTALLRGEGET